MTKKTRTSTAVLAANAQPLEVAMIRRSLFLSTAALLLATGVASATLTPAQQCEITKEKAIKTKYACLTAQDLKVIAGKTPNTAACATAFSKAFANAEAAAVKAGGSCPNATGDAPAIEKRIDATQGGIAQFLAGEGRFHDNGDGTVTDAVTGLMWEKKDQSGGLHDVNNTYTWRGALDVGPGGTLFTTLRDGLNSTSFAGYTDWRIPTISELETIIAYNKISPRVSKAFDSGCVTPCTVTTCSCTTGTYWSSTDFDDPVVFIYAWDADLNSGRVDFADKGTMHGGRGVRAGGGAYGCGAL